VAREKTSWTDEEEDLAATLRAHGRGYEEIAAMLAAAYGVAPRNKGTIHERLARRAERLERESKIPGRRVRALASTRVDAAPVPLVIATARDVDDQETCAGVAELLRVSPHATNWTLDLSPEAFVEALAAAREQYYAVDVVRGHFREAWVDGTIVRLALVRFTPRSQG